MAFFLGIKEKDNIFFKADDLSQALGFFHMLSTGQKIIIPKKVEYEIFKHEDQSISLAKLWVEVTNAMPFNHQFCLIDTQGKRALNYPAEINSSLQAHRDGERAKEVAAKFITALNFPDLTIYRQLIHPQCLMHSIHGDILGRDEVVQNIILWQQAFPGFKVDIDAVSNIENLVEVQWSFTGNHSGNFGHVDPTGRTVTFQGVTVFLLKEFKIVELWVIPDMTRLMAQLGREWKNPTASIARLLASSDAGHLSL